MQIPQLKIGQTVYQFSRFQPGKIAWDVTKKTMQVTSEFFLADRLVSQDSFRTLMGFNPTVDRSPNTAMDPVVDVSWHEAVSFFWQLNFGGQQTFNRPVQFCLPTRGQLLLGSMSGNLKRDTNEWCLDPAGDISDDEDSQDQVSFPAVGTAWTFSPQDPLLTDYRPTVHRSGGLGFRMACLSPAALINLEA